MQECISLLQTQEAAIIFIVCSFTFALILKNLVTFFKK